MVLPTWTMRLASHAHDLDENAHDTKGGWHQPVRVATTADITIATALNSGDTIDGVTLATGDRVLVKDQSADEQNGIYIAGATPARSEDGDASEEILGSLVYVIAGTANGGKVFRNTNTAAIVIDTDTISFDELAAGSSIATLDDIPDVNAPSPSDGDVLTWDSTPGEWIAAAPGASGSLTVEEDGGTPTVTNVDHIVFASSGIASVDVTDDTGGQVTVTVSATAPGGGTGDPVFDAFGAADTAYEFASGGMPGGLTAMGSADVESANGTIAGHLLIEDDDSTQVGRYASVSAPCTVIVKITDFRAYELYQYVGMMVGEATPGKLVTISLLGGASPSLVGRRWTTPGDGSPGAITLINVPTDSVGFAPWYLGIKVTSTTDIALYASRSGVAWMTLNASYDPTMTIGSAGVSLGNYAGGSQPRAAGAYDYIRIWNSALTFPAFS